VSNLVAALKLTGLTKEEAGAVSDQITAAGGKTETRIVPAGVDVARGWGFRRSVAEDFLYDTPVQLGTASGGSLSSLTDCTDWQFEVKNNLKAVPVIQSAGTASLLHKFLRERNRELTGEVTLEFQSPWALTALLANQQFSLNFLLGGGHQALFTYCMWEEFPPATKVKDLVSVRLKWIAETVAIT